MTERNVVQLLAGTRVPMILRAPHLPSGVSNLLVESVDLYPTVASLAGLPPPPDLDGVDLTPLFHDPNPATPPKPNVSCQRRAQLERMMK